MKINKNKEKKLKEIHGHIWNLYAHLFEDRRRIEDKLTYLLAITTLFLLGYVQLFQSEIINFKLEFLPFSLMLAAALMLFIQFISKRMNVPWFDKEQITNFLDKGEFYTKSLEEILTCALDTWEYMLDKSKILRLSFTLLYSGIVLGILIKFFTLDLDQIKIVLISAFAIASIGLYFYIFENAKKGYAEKHHLESDKIREYFDKWLKDELKN